MNHSRILLKLSGEALKGEEGEIFNYDILENILNQLSLLRDKKNLEILIVIGGGNIWRGEMRGDNFFEDDADYMGMTSTLINSLALKSFFNKRGLEAEIQSNLPIKNLFNEVDIVKGEKLLSDKKILIFGGGTGKPGVSTDTLAANIAMDFNCDAILMAKNEIDGVYSGDPNKVNNVEFFDKITYSKYLDLELKVIDSLAIKKISNSEKDIHVIVFKMNKKDNIINLWDNKNIKKTIIHN